MNLTESEIKYKSLFEESPISIWEEDFSDACKYLNSLREDGITDFKEYFANNPDKVDVCSRMVKILNVNKATVEMYHAKSKEDLLTDLKALFTEYSKRTFVEQLVLIANGATHYEGECVNKTIDGKELDVYLQWSVTKKHKKDYSIVFVSLIDITSAKTIKRKLEESEEKFRTITNSANDAIVMIDNRGKINFWNRAAEVIFGRKSGEVIGKSLNSVLTPEGYKEAFQKGFGKFKHTGKGNVIGKTIEMYAQYKDGSEFPVELSITGIKINGQWNGLSIIRDISKRKKTEEENRHQREQIKLINKILRHDLSNNLAAINSTINNYKRDGDDNNLKVAKEYIEKSAELIMKMREHEFLIASTNLKIYDISEQFENILNNYQTIKYSIDGKCKVFADDSLNSVIDNLIRNAVVHSGTDRIDIRIISSARTCEVKVIDYGKGIPDDIKMKIFDEGFKYGATGHSGLGLYIVQKAVKSWDGDISIEDNTPKGSIFKMYLKKVN
ncbi:MAG: PAS domain-containing sensor histidine kinase [Candidatus Tenebribacter burtonii]|jgi:PAS domain S-box-containing protein|nr:PAS domain-containing sensor histidine kinase [Candidatus Tenebribacter burtonii]